jgi:2-keto-4-pentenoate hydratase/2-oxohepta-3-ene-1,7-dioic acid hydratase in catechol pathway
VKLARFSHAGQVRLGLVEDEAVRPLGEAYPTLGAAISDPRGAEASAEGIPAIPLDAVRLLAPVDAASRIFAVAQNYHAHAREVSGTDAPPAPIIFLKPVSSLVGADEPIGWPPVTTFLDYEAELAIVIGRDARQLDASQAEDAIFGAACFNDVTGRDLQPALLGGKELIDWFSAKSLDGSSPLGPWIVSRDGIGPDFHDLAIVCRVNGETVQDDRTSSMVRGPGALISFISHRVALRAGDVIATGTPGGVGRARGVRLEEGDVVEVSIEGIGSLRNRVQAVTE